MALSGSLREFSLSEILQLLSSQRKTGCLRVTRDSEARVVYLLEGRIAAVRDRGMGSDDPLAGFLRRIHRLSEEQMRGISSIHAESGRDLVDLLLNGRYLEREELTVLYERLVLDVLHEVISWDDGVYSFANGNPPESVLPMSLSTESMLMEAVRRTDEMRRYQGTLGDPGLVLGLKELPDPDASLSEEEKELFGLVDGRRTLGELVAEAPLNEYEAFEALYRLVEAGWIEIQGRRAREEAPAPDPSANRRGLAPAWRTDAMLAAAAVALVVVMQLAGWRTAPAAVPAARDAYGALALADVRFALDVYRVERGQYPTRRDELVEAGGFTTQQTRGAGHAMTYAPADGGTRYALELSAPKR